MPKLFACVTRLALAAATAAALAAPAPAAAQARSLYWESLDVTARIDAEGCLHVAERQGYVFTGDWNGGERRFEVGTGEKLELVRVARIDSDTGEERSLVPGDVDAVDHYDWFEHRTLRWRSRLPGDPPFEGTRITYLIEYVYEGVVRGDGEGGLYRLQHDFAFPDRAGVVERFHLDLAVAPEWRVEGPFRPRFERRDLQPGDGVVVTLPLRYTGEGRPSAVQEPLPLPVRAALGGGLAAGFIALLALFLRGEARLGRFSPPRPEIDRAWLQGHLFEQRAEEVGALWDRKVGPPEVAALLARLVAEKKLESRVEPAKGLFAKPVLHLKLLVERSELVDHERLLVNQLFGRTSDETDTETVRRRFKKSGFDPAGLIAPTIEKRLGRRFPSEASDFRPASRKPTLALFLGGLACIGLEAISRPAASVAIVFLPAMVYLGPYGIAAAGAVSWRRRVERLGRASLVFVLPLLFFCGFTMAFLFFEELFGAELQLLLGLPGAAALVLLPLAVVRHVLNLARSRESAETIERRQLLATARRWFSRELRRREPQLDDAWYPYLLALGLDRQVNRWFRAFGAAAQTAGPSWSGSGAGGIGGGGGGAFSSGSSWTGGGGTFGGAGASTAWGVAAAGMAAGVAAPSSSGGGSSGGGGGGGSSGGGGGGGW